MIRITNWVADIPAEDKRIAYMGEHETCQRQFLLTGEDAARYAGWTFRLDMQFDVSTVTTATTRRTERVEEERERSMSETHDNEQTVTLKESGTVTDVEVDCESATDIVYLTQERCEEGLLLTWTVLAQHTRLPGRLWATLRAQNAYGAVKKSAIMLFAVDKAVEATLAKIPSISQFEQMERAMDGRLVVLEELTGDAVEAAKSAKATAASIAGDKEQTAVYKEQAQVAAKEAVEAAEGVHKSAYDVAVDNGFVGTEEEWLDSLQGATTEEIDAAAALAADAAERADKAAETAKGAAAGVLTIEQNSGELLRFWAGTQEEYDAIPEKDATCFYLISNDSVIEDLEKRDYIVAQGEVVAGGATWQYRKWNSGVAECFKLGEVTIDASNAIGSSGWYGSANGAESVVVEVLPSNLFEKIDDVNLQMIVWNVGILTLPQIVYVSTQNVKWYLARTVAGSYDYQYTIKITGRWK